MEVTGLDSDLDSDLDINVDTYLECFPFTSLPLELQLEIGKQSLLFRLSVRIRSLTRRWSPESEEPPFRFDFPVTPIVRDTGYFDNGEPNYEFVEYPFAIAHLAHRFHRPLMHFFFSNNAFEISFGHRSCRSLQRRIGREYFGAIKKIELTACSHVLVSVWESGPAFIEHVPALFPGLKKVVVECDERHVRIEETKKECLGLLERMEGLKVVEFYYGEAPVISKYKALSSPSPKVIKQLIKKEDGEIEVAWMDNWVVDDYGDDSDKDWIDSSGGEEDDEY